MHDPDQGDLGATVLAGLLDRSSLSGESAEIEALGLDLEDPITGACSLPFGRLYGR